jgi:hypothetical protein
MKANLILKLMLIGIIHLVASPIAYALDPTAVATTTNVTSVGGTSYTFTVRYADDGEIDVGSLDSNDVRVTGRVVSTLRPHLCP